MRNWYIYALLVLFGTAVTPALTAQDTPPSPHLLAAKVVLMDYGIFNDADFDFSPIPNGLEVAYLRNINKFLNFGFPVKVGLANATGYMNRRTFLGVDAVLHLQYYTEKSFVVPYIIAGGGLVTEEFESASIQFPVGVGASFKIGQNSYFNLQGEYRTSLEESRNNLHVGAGFLFRLGGMAKDEMLGKPTGDDDKDGVINSQDECPAEAGAPALLGCPDKDGDSVADKIDRCPDLAGPAATLGCPDKDGDSVADLDDKCPDQAGTKDNNGCPKTEEVVISQPPPATVVDTDGDGVADKDDACPNAQGPAAMKGCPDTDGDGVPDSDDKCPNQPGTAARNGCPAMDSDGDGIIDDIDDCPEVAGLIVLKGCPDTDGDGIADMKDNCPTEAGSADLNGCPKKDSDRDGVFDHLDECPTLPGAVNLGGCPDTDRDGIPDKNDECPSVAGLKQFNGCPDTDADKDGVKDDVDQCPTLAGPADTNGCPDSDGDSVPDNKDGCPNVSGPYNGCPDTDGDGIEDSKDRCPKTPGVFSNYGCPEIAKEEKEYLEFATQAVTFEVGKSVINPESYMVLDKISGILQKYPDYKLRIVGHTDNVGPSDDNLSLSSERARSCYNYLISRAISKDRMVYKGLGETQPIATNTTEEGRELNRRVEFILFVE